MQMKPVLKERTVLPSEVCIGQEGRCCFWVRFVKCKGLNSNIGQVSFPIDAR